MKKATVKVESFAERAARVARGITGDHVVLREKTSALFLELRGTSMAAHREALADAKKLSFTLADYENGYEIRDDVTDKVDAKRQASILRALRKEAKK